MSALMSKWLYGLMSEKHGPRGAEKMSPVGANLMPRATAMSTSRWQQTDLPEAMHIFMPSQAPRPARA